MIVTELCHSLAEHRRHSEEFKKNKNKKKAFKRLSCSTVFSLSFHLPHKSPGAALSSEAFFAYEKQQQLSAVDRNATFAGSKSTLTLPSRTHSPACSQPLQLKSGTLCSSGPAVSHSGSQGARHRSRGVLSGGVCLFVWFWLIHIINICACKLLTVLSTRIRFSCRAGNISKSWKKKGLFTQRIKKGRRVGKYVPCNVMVLFLANVLACG